MKVTATRNWLRYFQDWQLDEVRFYPGTAHSMRPDKPLIPFTVEIEPIYAARIEACAIRGYIGGVDAIPGAIFSQGLLLLEAELGFDAALDRLRSTNEQVRSTAHWLAIENKKREAALAEKRKLRNACPTCGKGPQKGGARG